METITYNLRDENGDASAFYGELAAFSAEVHARLLAEAGGLIAGYGAFVTGELGERPRSDGEYGVELLTLGVAADRYAGASAAAPRPLLALLALLFRLRRRSSRLRPLLDPVRGFLAGEFLVPRIGADNPRHAVDFGRLLLWLEATGEFKDEVKRLRNWRAFAAAGGAAGGATCVETALKLLEWFRPAAAERLGRRTEGVAAFLRDRHPAYRRREDELFTGKEEVEYHLNMVGSEIMNLGFRERFAATANRVVLLPACMRSRPESECRATIAGDDIACGLCSPDCRIGHLTRLGRERGFRALIVPHSTGFTRWLERWADSEDTGVVAVACLLNIVVGGYEMRELNIPSQCVPLDFCGCGKHWHAEGLPTDLDAGRLLELVNLT